jgi:hypothetical protein
MEPLVAELHQQYLNTLAMLHSVLERCPDEMWEKEYAGVPFWREAYHALFWTQSFMGRRSKVFHPHPFGKDIDPRLFTPPNNTCGRAEALNYLAQTESSVDQVFAALTCAELSEGDPYDETEFRSVYHRLMYGLRHAQHHEGKLTAYLNLEGIRLDHWKG